MTDTGLNDTGFTTAGDTAIDTASSRDADGDGHEAARVGGDDCNDSDAAIHPGVDEVCGNLKDDDCNGLTDESCTAQGPPDPGGMYWICGLAPGESGAGLLLVALAVVLLRRLR